MKYPFLLSIVLFYFASHYSYKTFAQIRAVDQALKAFERYGFSGGVMIEKNGKIEYQKGFGFADYKNNIKNTQKTCFDLGSVTKHITAAAILRLEQDKLLKLDDPIGKYIEIKDIIKQKITIQQLINHTAGLEKDPKYKFQGTFSLQKDLPIILNQVKLKSSPGKKFRYSNFGYCLLGLIIEKITKKSYQDFIQQVFFTSLGMKQTTFYKRHQVNNISLGYESTDFTQEKVNPYGYSSIPVWMAGASGIVSTFEDMHKWMNALFEGKVLSKKQINKYLTPVGGAINSKYACGVRVVNTNGQQLIFHDGDTKGHEVKFMYFPQSGYRFLFYVNNRDRWRNVIQKLLMNYAFGHSIVPLPSPTKQLANLHSIKNVTTKNYEVVTVKKATYLVALTQQSLFELTDLEISQNTAETLNIQAKKLATSIISNDTAVFRQFIDNKRYVPKKRLDKIKANFKYPYDSFVVMGTAVWKPGINQTFIKFKNKRASQVLRFVWHPRKPKFLFFGSGKNQLAIRRLIPGKNATFYTYHPKDKYYRSIKLHEGKLLVKKNNHISFR